MWENVIGCVRGGMENEGKRNIKIGVKVFFQRILSIKLFANNDDGGQEFMHFLWMGVRRFQKRNKN